MGFLLVIFPLAPDGGINNKSVEPQRLSGLRLWKAQDQINNSTLVSRSAELHGLTIRVMNAAFALDLVNFPDFSPRIKVTLSSMSAII